MAKNKLAPGFRFHPTDLELILYYLKRKVLRKRLSFNAIAEVDIYKYAPWDLPDKSCLKTGDLKWYFFCPITKKYGKGDRFNRATIYGYWKATGKDKPVEHKGEVVGMRKTLVFQRGKPPRGERTNWVMHEYRLEEKNLADRGNVQDTYMLCVVFEKDGVGPRNGTQYGAPFKEEDWTDDDEEENAILPGSGPVSGSLCGVSTVAVGGTSTSNIPESVSVGPSVNSTAYADSTFVEAPQGPVVANTEAQVTRDEEPNGNILAMLDPFTEDEPFHTYSTYNEDDDVAAMLGSFTEVDDPNNWSFQF